MSGGAGLWVSNMIPSSPPAQNGGTCSGSMPAHDACNMNPLPASARYSHLFPRLAPTVTLRFPQSSRRRLALVVTTRFLWSAQPPSVPRAHPRARPSPGAPGACTEQLHPARSPRAPSRGETPTADPSQTGGLRTRGLPRGDPVARHSPEFIPAPHKRPRPLLLALGPRPPPNARGPSSSSSSSSSPSPTHRLTSRPRSRPSPARLAPQASGLRGHTHSRIRTHALTGTRPGGSRTGSARSGVPVREGPRPGSASLPGSSRPQRAIGRGVAQRGAAPRARGGHKCTPVAHAPHAPAPMIHRSLLPAPPPTLSRPIPAPSPRLAGRDRAQSEVGVTPSRWCHRTPPPLPSSSSSPLF